MRRVEGGLVAVGLLVSANVLCAACGGETASAPPATAAAASASAAPAATPSASGSAVASAAPSAEPAPAPAPAASQEDEEVSGDMREHHRHHHHGGVAMFIAMSLDSLGVTPEQSANIEKIQGDLFAKMEPARTAERKLLGVLADGVAAGKIDEGKVKSAIDGVKTASGGIHDAVVKSLNDLHAALTPEQRAALVDKVEAHWEVWKHANNQDSAPGDEAHPSHLERVAKDLSLTPDQVTKIRESFADKVKNHPLKFDAAQIDTHIQEFSTAFKADKFDAKTLKHGPFANQHLAVWGSRRMAHFYETIDPVLTADQRAKLSAYIKEHAEAKSGILDADKKER